MNRAIDRSWVEQSFHRQAADYDRYANVQLRIIQQLMAMVSTHVDQPPGVILDVGCGTGRLLAELHLCYPHATLHGIDLAQNMVCQASERLADTAQVIHGDAEQLPYDDDCFDLLVSSSTLQWLDTLQVFFEQAHRVMRKGGLLCCAFFGGATLHEVHDCYRDVITARCGADDPRLGRLHHFTPLDDVSKIMQESSFEQVVLTSEREVEYYPSLHELLRSIQRIGAGSAPRSGVVARGGLGWRGLLQEMSDLYQERYGDGDKIPANYEVFYLIARKIN